MARRWLTNANRLADAAPVALREALTLRNWNAPGRPEVDPQNNLARAVVELQPRHSAEENATLGGIYMNDQLGPRVRGQYRTSPALVGLRAQEPLLDADDLRAMMGNNSLGAIHLNPMELTSLKEAKGTLGHEYSHHTDNLEDPLWSNRAYQDMLNGQNPYANFLFDEMGLKEQGGRYLHHPAERKAEMQKAIMRGEKPKPLNRTEQELIGAYGEHIYDLDENQSNDFRWAEAEDDALIDSLYGSGALEPSDFERKWNR